MAKEDQQGIKMKIKVSTSNNNQTLEMWYLDLNKHLSGIENIISTNVIAKITNKANYTVLFEKLNNIILSKSSYKITSFIDFNPYAKMFSDLKHICNN